MAETQQYTVLRAFRLGRHQRWIKPSNTPIELLPVEAQYPVQMGWLKLSAEEGAAKSLSTNKLSKTGDK